MISEENKTILIHRSKSFVWRLGAYIAVAILGFIVDNIGLLDISPFAITLVALVIGEITKYLNSNLPKNSA